MRRRAFIALTAGAVAVRAWSGRSEAAAPPRIGILDPGLEHIFAAFVQGMEALDYHEGKNIGYVWRNAGGRADRIPALAKELAELKLDAIVTAGPPVRAVMAATKTIPIVFTALGDAVGMGVVQSLAHPGGNVTGLSFLNTEISPKRLQLLHEALPSARRIAVLFDYRGTTSTEPTEKAAGALGLALQILKVSSTGDLEDAFRAAVAGGAGAMNILASAFFNSERAILAELALKYRLASMCETDEYVHAGCLISYGPNLAALARRAASYVDRILKGAKPGDLPVEQPTTFELVINLRTARAMGVAIAPEVLNRADEVVE